MMRTRPACIAALAVIVLSVLLRLLAPDSAGLATAAEAFAPSTSPATAPSDLPKPDADGWISLFNGKDLAGWDGDPKVWSAHDGYISGKGENVEQNTFLIFNHPFRNFVLEAKIMLIKGRGFTNSGIQYRSQVFDPARWRVKGYQADAGEDWWGALYDEGGKREAIWKPAPEVAKSVKSDDWNQYVIEANGAKLRHTLNGVVAGELEDKDPSAAREGIIALQYHKPGDGFEVRFRDIRIKLLPDDAAPAK